MSRLALPDPETYVSAALDLNMTQARLLSFSDLVFDRRVQLKCLWGCESGDGRSPKCSFRGSSHEERLEMIRTYSSILLLHSHDGRELSRAVVALERQAFLDGHVLAFGIRYCGLCRDCAVDQGKACVQPQKIRPCESLFGIDVFSTVRRLGWPCQPLKDKTDKQNRYGLVCIC